MYRGTKITRSTSFAFDFLRETWCCFVELGVRFSSQRNLPLTPSKRGIGYVACNRMGIRFVGKLMICFFLRLSVKSAGNNPPLALPPDTLVGIYNKRGIAASFLCGFAAAPVLSLSKGVRLFFASKMLTLQFFVVKFTVTDFFSFVNLCAL